MQRQMTVRTGADLGAALAEARRARSLTQQQLAESVNLDRTYLAKIEAGTSVQMLDRTLRLLRRLGAEVTVTLPEPTAPPSTQ
jgi:transcriptional regulator with XRE-family HTH domain